MGMTLSGMVNQTLNDSRDWFENYRYPKDLLVGCLSAVWEESGQGTIKTYDLMKGGETSVFQDITKNLMHIYSKDLPQKLKDFIEKRLGDVLNCLVDCSIKGENQHQRLNGFSIRVLSSQTGIDLRLSCMISSFTFVQQRAEKDPITLTIPEKDFEFSVNIFWDKKNTKDITCPIRAPIVIKDLFTKFLDVKSDVGQVFDYVMKHKTDKELNQEWVNVISRAKGVLGIDDKQLGSETNPKRKSLSEQFFKLFGGNSSPQSSLKRLGTEQTITYGQQILESKKSEKIQEIKRLLEKIQNEPEKFSEGSLEELEGVLREFFSKSAIQQLFPRISELKISPPRYPENNSYKQNGQSKAYSKSQLEQFIRTIMQESKTIDTKIEEGLSKLTNSCNIIQSYLLAPNEEASGLFSESLKTVFSLPLLFKAKHERVLFSGVDLLLTDDTHSKLLEEPRYNELLRFFDILFGTTEFTKDESLKAQSGVVCSLEKGGNTVASNHAQTQIIGFYNRPSKFTARLMLSSLKTLQLIKNYDLVIDMLEECTDSGWSEDQLASLESILQPVGLPSLTLLNSDCRNFITKCCEKPVKGQTYLETLILACAGNIDQKMEILATFRKALHQILIDKNVKEFPDSIKHAYFYFYWIPSLKRVLTDVYSIQLNIEAKKIENILTKANVKTLLKYLDKLYGGALEGKPPVKQLTKNEIIQCISKFLDSETIKSKKEVGDFRFILLSLN